MSILEVFVETLEGRIRELSTASAALVDAVERYARQECLRKSVYGSGAYDDETMRFIFPELRESEDERIRKAILQKVREASEDGCETFGGVEIKSVRAWLEKQKEQKPAEWSEEDELKMNALLNYLDPDKGGTKYSSYAQLTEWYNWLKSLRPQPKQEEDVGKELLYVAEKQYERGKRDGYREGFDDGYKKANEAMSFHYDMFHNSTPCYAPGGVCTNPQMDCINCPKKTTGGSFTITAKSDEK